MVPPGTAGPSGGCPCLRDSPDTVSHGLPIFPLPGWAPGKGLGQAHTPLIGPSFRAYVSWPGGAVCFGDVVPNNISPGVIRALGKVSKDPPWHEERADFCLSVLLPAAYQGRGVDAGASGRKPRHVRPQPLPPAPPGGNPKAFPGQPRYRISPAFPKSDLESFPGWTCPKILPKEASGRHPGRNDLTLGN